jgi:hypothetical protein
VRSASSGIDSIDNNEVFREPSARVLQILLTHRVGFSTARSTRAVVTSSVAAVCTNRGRPTFLHAVGVTLLQSSKRISD